MGSKRDYSTLAAEQYDDDDNESVAQASNKRRREQHPKTKSKQTEGKTDPTYGQKTAFPGLDDGEMGLSDEDLEFEECGDAIAYLQSVRQEARHVPHIIVAPKAGPQLPEPSSNDDPIDNALYDNGVGDSRGYYQDGAYTAAPSPPASVPPSPIPGTSWSSPDVVAARSRALREAYYCSLATQFLALREKLHQIPSPQQIAALPQTHGTQVGSFGPKSWTFKVWTKRIRHTDPLPVQIAALDRQSVLKLIRVILGGKFIRRGYELRERTSRWIWALLARLPDRGELGYDEVGWVRELGKRAVLMMVSMAQMNALREQVDDADDLDGEDFEDEEGLNGEMVVDEDDVGVGYPPVNQEVEQATAIDEEKPVSGSGLTLETVNEEEGEVDMDLDDGEVTDKDNDHATADASKDAEANEVAAVKARLLARLQETPAYEENPDELEYASDDGEPSLQEVPATNRATMNLQVTLNMILTVAGEFYGQRDLLEFRNPFPYI